MRKALCTHADQSKAQRAVTTNHHREAGKYSVPPPANKCKGTFTAERKLK